MSNSHINAWDQDPHTSVPSNSSSCSSSENQEPSAIQLILKDTKDDLKADNSSKSTNWADATDDWGTYEPSSPPPLVTPSTPPSFSNIMNDQLLSPTTTPPTPPTTPTSFSNIMNDQLLSPTTPPTTPTTPPTTPTTPPTTPPTSLLHTHEHENEFWTLAKIIAIHKHGITMVQHQSGKLIKCRPQTFSFPTKHRPHGCFIDILKLPFKVGDYTEILVSDLPPPKWDPQKGGKDISLWGLECLHFRDALTINHAFTHHKRASQIAFTKNIRIKSTGKFAIATFGDLSVFCPHPNSSWKKGDSVNTTLIPFQSSNKHGKTTHFIAIC